MVATYKDCHDCAFDSMCTYIGDWVGIRTPCPAFKDKSRYVELPLKVGDTFYTFNYDEDAISEQIVDEIRIIDDIEGDNIMFYGQCVVFTLNEIGSFAFFTKAEAEQALKERENDE